MTLAASIVPAWAAPPAESFKSAQRYFLRATLSEHRGDYAGALEAYEAALAADPNSAYICGRAVDMALEAGNLDQGLRLAKRLVAIDSRSAKAQLALGRVLWARGDAAAAQAAFAAALKLDPHSSETMLSLGSLLGERAPDQARELLNKFIHDNPDGAAEAHYQLAKIDFETGRLDAAVTHLKAGIALEPESLPLHYALAQAYETQAATEAAIAAYRGILELDPSNVALIDRIGELRQAQGRLEEARAQFEEAHRLQRSDPVSCLWLAADAESRGDWGRAADVLKTSAALADDPLLNQRLSYYATQAGRLAEAVRILEAAHARWPGDDQIDYYLALGYDDLKAPEKALKLLRQVLALKPDFRDARYQLAACLERLNQMDDAEREFRLLLAEKPDDASALNYLGYSLADRGLKLPEAERLIREAVRLSPAEPAYLDSLGWVLYKQGRSAEAAAQLELAARRGPEDATVWDHLGDALAAAGRPQAAWRAWKRAEALAETPLASGRKAAKLQGRFTAEEMGPLYLSYLAAVHGRLAKLSAVCRVSGEAGGQRFSYDGLLTFRGSGRPGSRQGELSLDLLGPLFAPLLRVRLGGDGFVMDAIHLAGLDPDLIRQAVEGMFVSLRDFFSGDLFLSQPVSYRKGWWKRPWLEAGGRRLDLDVPGARLSALTPGPGPQRLVFGEFEKVGGCLVPRRVSFQGPGYVLTIRLEQLKFEFLPETETGAK